MSTAESHVKVSGLVKPEYSKEETSFVTGTADLLAKTAELGYIQLPEDRMGPSDMAVLFDAVQQAAESGTAGDNYVESLVIPVAEAWNNNGGRAPGRLGGFFGTTFTVEKNGDGEYTLSIGGTD